MSKHWHWQLINAHKDGNWCKMATLNSVVTRFLESCIDIRERRSASKEVYFTMTSNSVHNVDSTCFGDLQCENDSNDHYDVILVKFDKNRQRHAEIFLLLKPKFLKRAKNWMFISAYQSCLGTVENCKCWERDEGIEKQASKHAAADSMLSVPILRRWALWGPAMSIPAPKVATLLIQIQLGWENLAYLVFMNFVNKMFFGGSTAAEVQTL